MQITLLSNQITVEDVKIRNKTRNLCIGILREQTYTTFNGTFSK